MLIEKFFSENSHNLSVGIANVNPKTKNLEENKKNASCKFLWDMIMPTIAFQNQVWVMAANAVGLHSLEGINYCGGSGIWAPSGINMLTGSDTKEELLILHNIDMIHEVEAEKNDIFI